MCTPPADLVAPAISLDVTKVIYGHSMSLPLPLPLALTPYSMGTSKSVDFAANQVKRHKKPWSRLRIKLKLFKSLAKKLKSNEIKT